MVVIHISICGTYSKHHDEMAKREEKKIKHNLGHATHMIIHTIIHIIHMTAKYTYFVHMEMCKKREGFFELGKAPHSKRESIKWESMNIRRCWAKAKYAREAEQSLNIVVSLVVHEGLRVELRQNKVSRILQPGKGRSPWLLQPTRSIPSRADPERFYNLLPPISANTQAITWAKLKKKRTVKQERPFPP